MTWKRLKSETPTTTEVGEWDGSRSEVLIVRTKEGEVHSARCYKGILDGHEFCDFYTTEHEYEIKNVEAWIYIPYFI